jgi:hypothetical protein
MSSETIIRPARGDELAAVLTPWQKSGVTPPSVTDSIDGLTRSISEPGAILLVAIIDGQIVGSVIGGWDGWRGNIYRLAVTPECRQRKQRALRQGRCQNLGAGGARTSVGDRFLGILARPRLRVRPTLRPIYSGPRGWSRALIPSPVNNECPGDEADRILAGIYNWFDEGFDAADLKDAKALDNLSV